MGHTKHTYGFQNHANESLLSMCIALDLLKEIVRHRPFHTWEVPPGNERATLKCILPHISKVRPPLFHSLGICKGTSPVCTGIKDGAGVGGKFAGLDMRAIFWLKCLKDNLAWICATYEVEDNVVWISGTYSAWIIQVGWLKDFHLR